MWFRQCLSTLLQVVEEGGHSGGSRLGFFFWVSLVVQRLTVFGGMTWASACSRGKGWMLQRVWEFLYSYHQPHGLEESTDDNLSCNFCFGKSCQGSTALKPPPRPFQRLHYNLRKSFGLVPWGNEASVTLVPACAHLRPGFSKNFQNPWAILAIWPPVHKHMRFATSSWMWVGRERREAQEATQAQRHQQRAEKPPRREINALEMFQPELVAPRGVILSPQGKKPWEDYMRPE